MVKHKSGDVVCGLHRAQGDEEREFLGSTSKLRSTASPGLAPKPVATILVVWPQNRSLGFSGLGLKIDSCDSVIWPTKSPRRFLGLGLKTKWAMVCWLRIKPTGDEDDVGHTLKSSGLLHLEASLARVSQSSLKTSGGATQMVHVASSWRSCGDEAKDGRVDETGYIRLF
jgi:hypothetical protein